MPVQPNPAGGNPFLESVAGADMTPWDEPVSNSLPSYPASFGVGDSLPGNQTPTASFLTQLSTVASERQNLQQEMSKILADLAAAKQGDTAFADASGSSTGDPHLAFDGSNPTAAGTIDKRWDDMGSHADLLDANASFTGGFEISTTATALNANGVAYNQTATVSTGNGGDTVTMGPGGQVAVSQNGQTTNLSKGQSLTLASGAVVSEAQDGSVTVTDANAQGGTISATLRWNGQGVDVDFASHGTYLGGDLEDGHKGVMA